MMLPRVPYALQSNSSWVARQNTGLGAVALPFGLFATGTDYTGWTWKEWAVLAGGAWFFFGRKR